MIAALILRLSSRKATRVLVLRSIQSNVVTMDNLRKAFVLPAASWISRVCSEIQVDGLVQYSIRTGTSTHTGIRTGTSPYVRYSYACRHW